MPEPAGERPLVVVIGGGVSGLAAARVLAGLDPVSEAGGGQRRPGARVLVLEAAPFLGGKVQGGSLAGHPVELGPDQFVLRDPSAERLCRHLGLGDDLVAPAARSAAVWSRGEMRGLPAGLVLGVPTDLDAVTASGIVSPGGVDRARQDALLDGPLLPASAVGLADPDPGENASSDEGAERSAGEILRARLGDEVVNRLVDPLLGGINAGCVDTMSLGVAAPQIAHALVGHRDVIGPLAAMIPPGRAGVGTVAFLGLKGGLARLVDACRAELEGAGVEIRTGTAVASLEQSVDGARWSVETAGGPVACDGVILAVPGIAGAELVRTASPSAAAELSGVPYSSVAVLTLAFSPGSLSLPANWTGVLVPRIEGRLMTAATWLSVKWPWMASEEALFVRVSAGRYGDERVAGLDDDDLAAHLTSELREIAAIEAEPFAHAVTRWDHAFPQYLPGHRQRIGRINRALAVVPGLELAGAVLGGIGIPACITSGEAAAVRMGSLIGW